MIAKILKQNDEDEEKGHLTSFLLNSTSLDTYLDTTKVIDVEGKESYTGKVKEVDGKEKTEYTISHSSVFNLIDDSRDVTVLEEERMNENEEIHVVF